MRPRWFYPLLAVCLVALTVAAILRLRWQPYAGHLAGEPAMVDTWRGRACLIGESQGHPIPICLPMGHDTLAVLQTMDPLIREYDATH